MTEPMLPPNPEVAHLTAEQLERIAGGNAESTDTHWIEHLDACTFCQQQLTRTAAEAAFWQQSSDLLREADAYEPKTAAGEAAHSGGEAAADEATTLVVRSLLAPSEQEESLGRLGRFEVLGIVGNGGMGIVLKCRDIDIDRVVAIKIPSPHLWRVPAALATLEREARSAAAVVHPHVIAIYQVDRWRDVPYLVMPYFPGPSLDRRILQSGPLPLAEAIHITRQMAEALAAAHSRGVIHRDVKPGNMLLGRGVERAVLSDFGLAKVQTQATQTASGMLAGTPAYLSPEQATGGEVGPASDLFSLGSVLWTMLVGQVPGAGLHPHAIVHRIASGRLPGRELDDRSLPDWVARLLQRMHQLDPAARYRSANELAEVLRSCERYIANPETDPLPPSLQSTRPTSRFRQKRTIAVLVGISLLLFSVSAFLPWPWDFTSEGGTPNRPTTGEDGDTAWSMPASEREPVSKSDSVAVPDSPPSVIGADTSESAKEAARADPTAQQITEMLDNVETSSQQILSELRELQESNP